MYRIYFLLLFIGSMVQGAAQPPGRIQRSFLDSAWAANSINTVIFRRNALASFNDTQFIAYYDAQGYVMLGKRKLGSRRWLLVRTVYKGKLSDAHNSISIAVDGQGYLHMAWNHHNVPLNYARGVKPGSLELKREPAMSGLKETRVTYPEFYRLPSGDLIFLFRDGESGKGNLVMEYYQVLTKKWRMLHSNLIDGGGRRNAYWQACVDSRATIHLSWVWRESADVASNHDICYARSTDGGQTWENSKGEKYQLPITAANAEYVARVPQNSELINQTSMSADQQGNPCLATYWKNQGDSIPQYHVLYFRNGQWHQQNLSFRRTSFSLQGMGTKAIPISRPQIALRSQGANTAAIMIFRDAERGNRVSAAITSQLGQSSAWRVVDLTAFDAGAWEPSFDTDLWQQSGVLSLFVQKVQQADQEGQTGFPPQMVQVVDWYLPNRF